MKGGDILRYALIAVAAYLLYKYAQEQGWLGGVTALPPGQPQPQPQLPPAQPQPPAQPPPAQPPAEPPVAVTTKDRVLQMARASGNIGTLTFDQWNWFYAQVTSRPGPPIEDAFPGVARDTQMTVDQWWAGISQIGFSGLARWPIMSAWAN